MFWEAPVAHLRSRLLQILLPALLSAGLIFTTALNYPLLTLGLVAVSVAMFWAALWSAAVLLGGRGARVLAVLALGLGWFAEQMGSSRGWFFGRYTYTDVLGPRLGDVPLAIPLMWLALCLVGYVLASLMLWRTPVHATPTLKSGALTAWLAAMIVTTFDLGADPYFVYVLKAWIMEKPDGGWFGETLQGFAGWMLVSFVIVAVFQALAAPRRVPAIGRQTRLAAWVPIGLYASGLVFQVLFGHPIEIRAIAFFAMGMPTLIAWVAWRHWTPARAEVPQAQPVHSVPLEPMGLQADPLADQTVAALIGPWSDADGATGPATDRLAAATRLMAGWTSNGALADWGQDDAAAAAADPAVVAALRVYVSEGRALPTWADAAKVERAEAIFMEQGPLSCTLLFCSSLPECYVLPNLAEVLHIAGQLEQHTEHRIRQTAAMVFPVMMKGGLMDASGAGVAQVLKVRLIHATIRHLILRGEPQTVRGQVAPRLQAGAPTGMHAALMSHGWDVDRQGLPCNQIELAYTLLTFSYSFLKGMRTLGLGLPRADEEAYLHAWNVMGHVLGVRRELMADTMDEAASLFERIQAQARGQAVSPDARPALGRALMQTMERTIRLPVVRGIPVPLTRWLIGPDTARAIGVDERVSWPTRLLFGAGRLLVRLIDTVVRVFSPGFSLSRMFTRIVGYHLLTHFLLDQTRPLNLPDQLLNPLTDTVAAWSDDPGAPGWLNRLEDRWTTTGHWRPAHGVGTTKRPVPDAEAVAS